MNSWMKMNLNNGASPIMEQLIMFHDHTMMIIVSIISIVMFMMTMMMKNKFINRSMLDNQKLEITWTILPTITLIMIALPSIKILYIMEEIINPSITIKAMGHQWYWSYEYSDKKKMEIESYMTKNNNKKKFRLLDVSNRLIVPFNTQTRMIISSSDVIHSWSIQSLGIKMDAVPGRLNQSSFSIKKPGIFYGQCSEICGMNHSFMPISIEAINMKKFINWMKNN
uniref:cytochrome c oxidase subunit II n=1 Tax=Caliscelis shandongensis TaxID=2886254 RepID=UPI001E7BC8E5|nr:cytochrome c oxidase subunit II [Caliscelis shandongensis]YP_011014877.1 cytochrome c oxidase subunit II [Caliscelis rhabdocladis]UDL72112.1 cytochrome c oxidase subunit 2 [Caliscelis shandongensis]WQB38571.1 cytochrome c oxidase subunit II [Caliscelis rhabdocladis]